jgi:hypothetical protein
MSPKEKSSADTQRPTSVTATDEEAIVELAVWVWRIACNVEARAEKAGASAVEGHEHLARLFRAAVFSGRFSGKAGRLLNALGSELGISREHVMRADALVVELRAKMRAEQISSAELLAAGGN